MDRNISNSVVRGDMEMKSDEIQLKITDSKRFVKDDMRAAIPLPGHRSSQTDYHEQGKLVTTLKTILLWNSWYRWSDYKFGLGRDVFKTKCGMDFCQTTTNRSDLVKADAVVFFDSCLDYSRDPVLPERAYPNQAFVYLNTEPPAKYPAPTERLGLEMNITVSYRIESMIYWPYGRVVTRRDDYETLTMEALQCKNRTIAWMVTRCDDTNLRMTYYKELVKYIPVDVYGKCGDHQCPERNRRTSECKKYINKYYKFYLAFENSYCTDYVTEKAFWTLQYHVVPIVMGAANYSHNLPPRSFIDVRDFNSPKQLAEYIQYLDNNDEEYLKYFDWKRAYAIEDDIPHSETVFCRLCEMLHERTKFFSNFDVGRWWKKDVCIQDPSSLREIYHIS